jgi:hypothetical protein
MVVVFWYDFVGCFWFKDAYSGTTDVDWSFNGRQGQTVLETVAVGSLAVHRFVIVCSHSVLLAHLVF